MTSSDLPQGWTWEGVLDRLGEHADLDETARHYGAITRSRVIKSGSQLLRLVLVYVLSGLSLRSTAAWAEQTGQASFSDVALLKRLKGCGPWLAAMVGTLSAAANPEGCCRQQGRRVVAVDATTVCSPGGKTKPYRILHTVYDVNAQRFVTTLVTERRHAERLDVGTVEHGDIRLGDRAYGRYDDLAAVQKAGADYVVRLSARSLKLVTRDAEPLDRAALGMRAEREGVQTLSVRIIGDKGDEPLRARVIFLPLPPDKAEAARRQMRRNARKWGDTPSDEALATAGCLMLITSLEAEDWATDQVLALYRRRWQVELAFKRLKSLLDLERLRAFDPDLVSAWIHGVLLVALLIDLERPAEVSTAPDSPRSATTVGL